MFNNVPAHERGQQCLRRDPHPDVRCIGQRYLGIGSKGCFDGGNLDAGRSRLPPARTTEQNAAHGTGGSALAGIPGDGSDEGTLGRAAGKLARQPRS